MTRFLEQRLDESLLDFPAVAILGPRQCGKTTLARQWVDRRGGATCLDLERPSERRTADGAEIDLVLTRGRRRIAVECKASTAPRVNRGLRNSLADLDIDEAWIIAPVRDSYPLRGGVTVAPLASFLEAHQDRAA